MTPDLVSQVQQSEVLLRGFRDPRCMAAMQMMQRDPEEALRQCQGDATVTAFLQEFGRLMAGHFEALGAQQQQGQGQQGGQSSSSASSGAGAASSGGINISPNSNNTAAPAGKIQEIGPLHAKVLQKQR